MYSNQIQFESHQQRLFVICSEIRNIVLPKTLKKRSGEDNRTRIRFVKD